MFYFETFRIILNPSSVKKAKKKPHNLQKCKHNAQFAKNMFSQLLLFCWTISSTLSMSSITASISDSFFCSSFETGRIISEVCCITKAAIEKRHFSTELSKVSCVGRNLHLLVFLLQFLKCRNSCWQ